MFNLNLFAAAGIVGLALLAAVSWQAYSLGYDRAEALGAKQVQAIRDEVAAANARIRADEARRQQAVTALLDARTEEVRRLAEQELEAQKRIAEYEAELESRDACTIGPDDYRRLR